MMPPDAGEGLTEDIDVERLGSGDHNRLRVRTDGRRFLRHPAHDRSQGDLAHPTTVEFLGDQGRALFPGDLGQFTDRLVLEHLS